MTTRVLCNVCLFRPIVSQFLIELQNPVQQLLIQYCLLYPLLIYHTTVSTIAPSFYHGAFLRSDTKLLPGHSFNREISPLQQNARCIMGVFERGGLNQQGFKPL